MKGAPPAELVDILASVPDFPDVLGYIWEWFGVLNQTRPSGFGISGVTEQEIANFCSNRRLRLSLFELDALRALDSIAIGVLRESEDGSE